MMKQKLLDLSGINAILKALANWDVRESVSIKATSNGTTYDRYDPQYGLHK